MSRDPRGAVYDAAEAFQASVRRLDEGVAQELASLYGPLFRDLTGQADGLIQWVARSVEAGEVFTVDRLRRSARYGRLLGQVRARLDGFGEEAAGVIGGAQRVAVERALGESERLMELARERALLDVPDEVGAGGLPAGMGIGAFDGFDRVPFESLDRLIGSLGDGTPLRAYFLEGGVTVDAPALSDEVVDRIRRELALALGSGWNPRVVARRFQDALGVGLTRALRIARTEMMRSYREASRENYSRNGFGRWEWLATLDRRTCMACVLLDGESFPVGQPMQAHVNCRCTMVPVLGFEVGRQRRQVWPERGGFNGTGVDWFLGLTRGQQRTLLGPGKYEAWRSGQIALGDLVREDRSRADTFGVQFVESSLVRALGGGGVTG